MKRAGAHHLRYVLHEARAANIILGLGTPAGRDTIFGPLPLGSLERDLISFLFDDGTSRRPLEEVRDDRIRESADPIRSFIEGALSDLSEEDLTVLFWVDGAGLLKMSLRGHDSTVEKAKNILGERVAIPPTQH